MDHAQEEFLVVAVEESSLSKDGCTRILVIAVNLDSFLMIKDGCTRILVIAVKEEGSFVIAVKDSSLNLDGVHKFRRDCNGGFFLDRGWLHNNPWGLQ
jgi:hypothetical protein